MFHFERYPIIQEAHWKHFNVQTTVVSTTLLIRKIREYNIYLFRILCLGENFQLVFKRTNRKMGGCNSSSFSYGLKLIGVKTIINFEKWLNIFLNFKDFQTYYIFIKHVRRNIEENYLVTQQFK